MFDFIYKNMAGGVEANVAVLCNERTTAGPLLNVTP